MLVQDPHFSLVHVAQGNEAPRLFQTQRRWVMPLEGRVECRGDVAVAGDCLLLEPGETLESDGARMLIGAMA